MPCSFWRWVMLLFTLRWIVVLWKNFVFFSPSLSHLILDFCLHSVSSCFSFFEICDSRIFSCSSRSSNRLLIIFLCCSYFISLTRSLWDLNMLPKQVWFHCLIFPLRYLSFCRNWIIFVPFGGEKLFHSVFIRLMKSGWDIHKASKRIGLWVVLLGRDQWREIGQWSDPEIGKMEAAKSSPMWIALSDSKNLSRREAIWCIPVLLLFQVKIPLLKGMSISQLF